jgi:ATP-dependent Clp protease ATP-binding subunit ClpX
MEETLLSVMYEVPSRKDVEKVIITPAVVKKEEAPTYVPRSIGSAKRAAKGEKSSEEKSA